MSNYGKTMHNYTCTKCDASLEKSRPEFRAERASDGRERLFRTVPELCDKCREKRFWAAVERLKDKGK